MEETTRRLRENFLRRLLASKRIPQHCRSPQIQTSNVVTNGSHSCCKVEAPPLSPPPSHDATSYRRSPLSSPLFNINTPPILGVASLCAATLRGTSCQPSTCSTATTAGPATPAVALHPSLPPVRGTRNGACSLVIKTFSRPPEQLLHQLNSTHATKALNCRFTLCCMYFSQNGSVLLMFN